MSQTDYEAHMKSYGWVYDKIQQFIERRSPVQDNAPIIEPVQAIGTVLTCEACQGSFKLAQMLLRD